MGERGDSTHEDLIGPWTFSLNLRAMTNLWSHGIPFLKKKKKKKDLCFKSFLIFTYLAPSLWYKGLHMGSLVVYMGSLVAGCPTACDVLVP